MAHKTEEKEIIEILKGGDKLIFKNIDLLIQDYKERTGRKVNTGCPSCVRVVILTLKSIHKMVNFKFKRSAASYKNKKGDKTTISNSTMSNEKALEFLKTDPKRIVLFSVYPSNWKKMIKGDVETPAQKEISIAVEAEALALEESKKQGGGQGVQETEEDKAARLLIEAAEDEAKDLNKSSQGSSEGSQEGSKAKEADLMKMSLSDLRKAYPKVKATSIRAFVDKVLAL